MGICVYMGFFSVAQAADNSIYLQEILKKYSETSMVFQGTIAGAYFFGRPQLPPALQELRIVDVIGDLNDRNKQLENEDATLVQLLEKEKFEEIGEKYLELK